MRKSAHSTLVSVQQVLTFGRRVVPFSGGTSLRPTSYLTFSMSMETVHFIVASHTFQSLIVQHIDQVTGILTFKLLGLLLRQLYLGVIDNSIGAGTFFFIIYLQFDRTYSLESNRTKRCLKIVHFFLISEVLSNFPLDLFTISPYKIQNLFTVIERQCFKCNEIIYSLE